MIPGDNDVSSRGVTQLWCGKAATPAETSSISRGTALKEKQLEARCWETGASQVRGAELGGEFSD